MNHRESYYVAADGAVIILSHPDDLTPPPSVDMTGPDGRAVTHLLAPNLP
jgi:hypothetical protein